MKPSPARISLPICMRLLPAKNRRGRAPSQLHCLRAWDVPWKTWLPQTSSIGAAENSNQMTSKTYDFVIIGAGVFGAWTAHFVRRSGASVALLDAYGPANSRASSAGETRVIRMGYGPDELYTRWSMRSLPVWREFAARIGREIFHQTGVLWLSNDEDAYLKSVGRVLGQA